MTHLVRQLSKKLANAGTISPTDLLVTPEYLNTLTVPPGLSTSAQRQGYGMGTAGLNFLAGNDVSDAGLHDRMRGVLTGGQNTFTNWLQNSPGTADWLVSERNNPNLQRMIYDRYTAENPDWRQNLIPEVDPMLMEVDPMPMVDQFGDQYQEGGGGFQGVWEGVQGAWKGFQGAVGSASDVSGMLFNSEGYQNQYLEGLSGAVANNPALLRKINQGTVGRQFVKNRGKELGNFWNNLGGDIGTGAGNILTYLLGLLGKINPDLKNLFTRIQERHSNQGSQQTPDDEGTVSGTGGAN